MPISGEEFCVPVMQALHQQGIAVDDLRSFADQNEISDWALESVNTIFPISGAGRPVMQGTENNRFSPKGSYTREQAAATVYRLYIG